MRSPLARPAGVLLVAFGFLGSAPAADPIPADKFSSVRALVKPAAGEDRWAVIPWRTSLWEARREAAKAGKPIVLWEMDGHPLGCV
jgi:hypothetical protein